MLSCFRFIALVFLLASFSMISLLFRSPHPTNIMPDAQNPAHAHLLFSVVLHMLARLLRVTPIVLAFLYGMAWWTVSKGKPSGRGWAIAASLAMLFQLVPFLNVTYYAWVYAPRGAWMGFLIVDGLVLAIGIPGLVAFGRREAMAQPVIAPKPPRIAGDGTSHLLDALAWIIGIAGYIAAMNQWHRWGQAQQMPRTHGGLLLLLAALLLATALHEIGHATTGLALGMKLRAFIVGPFQWRIRDGRWNFKFILGKSFSAGGATALVPTNPHQSLSSEICMISAGAMVNLLTGLIALYAAFTAKGQPYEQYWEFFAYFSTISLLAFASNLIPMQSEAAYSDGGRIYQLLKGGPLADLYQVFNLVGSTAVTPLRPRDYDIDAIQRAELSFKQGLHAMLLRLLASSYFLDRGMIHQASEAVAEAERICQESALDIPAEICMAFVYRTAYLRRDAADARRWWELMEAKKPTHFGVDYWLAQSALLWIEGRNEEAREAWKKANIFAQKLPSAGDYEFDRYRCALLHDCIESAGAGAAS